MKNIVLRLRTLFVLAMMCFVSSNAWGYRIIHDGDVIPDPQKPDNSKIFVVEDDVSVGSLFLEGGYILVVQKGATLRATDMFRYRESIIYVFGKLDLTCTTTGTPIAFCTIYFSEEGSIVGDYDDFLNTIHYNVDPSSIGNSVQKNSGFVPSPYTGYVGYPSYYMLGLATDTGDDFLPFGYYEDAECTKSLNRINWIENNTAQYRTAYDTGKADGSSIYTVPTEEGMRMKVAKKDGKVYEFQSSDIRKVEQYRATEVDEPINESINESTYTVFQPYSYIHDDIFFGKSTLLVKNDAIVNNFDIFSDIGEKRVLVIAGDVTLRTERQPYIGGDIYIFGNLDNRGTIIPGVIDNGAHVYVMQGGRMEGLFVTIDGEISYNVKPSDIDPAIVEMATNLPAKKETFDEQYQSVYDYGYADGVATVYTTPTEAGMRLRITTVRNVFEFDTKDIESVEYYRAEEE